MNFARISIGGRAQKHFLLMVTFPGSHWRACSLAGVPKSIFFFKMVSFSRPAPRSSQGLILSGQGVSLSVLGVILSAPGLILIAPGLILSAPGLILSAPGISLSVLGINLNAPGLILSAPDPGITASWHPGMLASWDRNPGIVGSWHPGIPAFAGIPASGHPSIPASWLSRPLLNLSAYSTSTLTPPQRLFHLNLHPVFDKEKIP